MTPATEGRTGPVLADLVEAVQLDIGDAVDQLEGALARVRELESQTAGVNGLQSRLRAEGSKLQQVIETLRGESVGIERKLLGTGREPITEKVDHEHAKRVAAAKVAEAEAEAVPAA